jgi:hypothetical protein
VVNLAARYGGAMPTEYFTFDLPNPPHMKSGWHRATWVATREEIAERGGRIVRLTETRSGVGSTAGHVQSSPAPSAPLPEDLGAPRDSSTGTRAGEERAEPSRDPAGWGRRLDPETPSDLP